MKNHLTEAADSESRCTWPGLGPGEYFAEKGELKIEVLNKRKYLYETSVFQKFSAQNYYFLGPMKCF